MTDILKLIPPMLTGAELHKALAVSPEYDPAIRQASAAERLVVLNSLYEVYYPLSMSSTIYSKMYLSMIRSLQKKTGKLAVQQRNANHFGKGQSYFGICNSDSYTLTGASGVGKSTAIARALDLCQGNSVITLKSPYCKILPVLVVQCPWDSSIKGLFLSILKAIDEALDTTYYPNAAKTRVTTDLLIGMVSNALLNGVGLLVVDEIQNVVNSRNGTALIGSLIQLINSSGVSICMVGTPECIPFFEQDYKLARRSLGIHIGEIPFDADFAGFCATLCQYQYVSGDMVLTDGIIQWLYDHSGGVTANVVSLIHDAQEIAILDGSETVTIETLNQAYSQRLGLLHSHIDLARVKMATKREYAPELPVLTETATSFEKGLLAQTVAEAKRKELPVLDLLKQRISIVEVMAR